MTETEKEYRYIKFPVQLLRSNFSEFYNKVTLCDKAIDYGVIELMERKHYEGVKGFIRACSELRVVYGGFNEQDYKDQPKDAQISIKESHYTKHYQQAKSTYQEIKDSLDRPITVSIKIDRLLDFIENPKTELEVEVFRFFIAINSIQGSKKYGQATYKRVFALMFGYNTDKDLEGSELSLSDKSLYSKISSRKRREKIVYILQTEWKLKWYPAGKDGNFFSYTLGRTALATISETLKVKRRKRMELLKNANKNARDEAIKDLKNKGLY